MADYTYDFSAQADAATFTFPTEIITFNSWTFENDNGIGIRSVVTGGRENTYFCHDADYGTTILAEATVGQENGTDPIMVGVAVRSGGNAGAGYFLSARNGSLMLYEVGADGVNDATIGGPVGGTITEGTVVSLEYDTTDGGIICRIDGGSAVITATDTTYSAESLGAAAGLRNENFFTTYLSVFGGTGLASGASIVPQAMANYRMRAA
jgi:hypothetical protein